MLLFTPILTLRDNHKTMAYETLLLTPDLLKSHPNILAGIVNSYASCIVIDGTLATFLPA